MCKRLDFFFAKVSVIMDLQIDKEGSRMILDMLKKRMFKILDHVDDWKEAITVSLRSLEEQGYVTPDYAKGIHRHHK